MNPILQERVVAAYQQAPEPIQEVFSSEVTANVIDDIRTQYRLHVDVAGAIGNEIGYLLLGLRSPAEFLGTLILGGTDEQTARSIMQEVNDRIFIPLQRRMVRGSNETPPSPTAPEQTPTPAPIQTQQPLPVQTMPTPAVVFAQPSAPQTAPLTPEIPNSFSPEPIVTPQTERLSALELAQTETQSYVPVASTEPTPVTVPQFAAAPQPFAPIPTFTAPVAPPQFSQSPAPIPPLPVAPPTPPAQPHVTTQKPLTREYSADPYREPV